MGSHDIKVLSNIRTKFAKKVIIGHLNINSIANKIDALSLIIKDKLDIIVIGETKLDDTFPDNHLVISGSKKHYRLDKNRHGGGVMLYVRGDIPSKLLAKHHFSKNIEAIFVEINLRKFQLLRVGTYHSTHPVYGTTDNDYFEQMGFALHVYSSYGKYLLAGDFNITEEECCLQTSLTEEECCLQTSLTEEECCLQTSLTEEECCLQTSLTEEECCLQTSLTEEECCLQTSLTEEEYCLQTSLTEEECCLQTSLTEEECCLQTSLTEEECCLQTSLTEEECCLQTSLTEEECCLQTSLTEEECC